MQDRQPPQAFVGRAPELARVAEVITQVEASRCRKAVEYYLGNIYAKCGLQGRQQLPYFVERWRQPAVVQPDPGRLARSALYAPPPVKRAAWISRAALP